MGPEFPKTDLFANFRSLEIRCSRSKSGLLNVHQDLERETSENSCQTRIFQLESSDTSSIQGRGVLDTLPLASEPQIFDRSEIRIEKNGQTQ